MSRYYEYERKLKMANQDEQRTDQLKTEFYQKGYTEGYEDGHRDGYNDAEEARSKYENKHGT
jgi:flagellar biosynthesis/type III secretory pathway protein FliH